MQYKTIILELIQQQPKLHELLKADRRLLSTVDRFAGLLKNHHKAWISQLRQSGPETDERQLASEAMEVALEEIQRILPTGSEATETEGFSLDEAMQFLGKRIPPS